MTDRQLQHALTREWDALVRELAPAAKALRPRPAADPPSRLVLYAELQEVLDRLAAMREPLEGRLQALATSAWTTRELLAHMASWATEFVREVELALAGTSFDQADAIVFKPVGGPRAWNETAIQRRRDASVADCFEEFDRSTAQLQDIALTADAERLHAPVDLPIIRGAPPAPWRASAAQAILAKCGHDHHHLDRIATLLAEA